MKKHNATQAGFGMVETVTLLLILVGVAGASWLVYNHNHKTQTHNATTTAASSKTTLPTHTTTPTPTPRPAANEFAVPELSFKMTLPTGLTPSDLQYVAQVNRPGTTTNPGPWSTATFTTKSLLQLDSGCTADQGPIGTVVRYSQDPKVSSEQQVGQYYFVFQSPQGSCTGNLSAGNLEQSQTALLKQAFETIGANN